MGRRLGDYQVMTLVVGWLLDRVTRHVSPQTAVDATGNDKPPSSPVDERGERQKQCHSKNHDIRRHDKSFPVSSFKPILH
jgi:hypothetical protein